MALPLPTNKQSIIILCGITTAFALGSGAREPRNIDAFVNMVRGTICRTEPTYIFFLEEGK